MLRRLFAFGGRSHRVTVGLALWLTATAPLALVLPLSSCAGAGHTSQQRKTERYKRKHPSGSRIPCPTKDC